jgi:DNA-binding IclR family transcriptional regulator
MSPTKRRSPRVPARRDYSAPALEKGIDVVELLAAEEIGLTVSEISSRLGRQMSELFRIIVVMERRGWLQKDAQSARYNVTYHVLRLAHRGTPASSLTVAAAPAMEALTARISQSCHLVVRSGTQGLVVLRQENLHRDANLLVRLGASLRLAETGSGHVLLAHLDPEEQRTVLDSLKRPRGMTRAMLEATLARVRKQGYELQRSSSLEGVTDISHPIRGFSGKVVAALTVPYLHVHDKSCPVTVDQARRLLQGAARRISHSLGFTR